MISGAPLSDKSARQCLTKNNSNKMRTGGRYGQSNLLFVSSSARAPHNRVASKIDEWSPCACILFSIIQDCESGKETLCIHSFHKSGGSSGGVEGVATPCFKIF